MRRIALLGTLALLSACAGSGFGTFFTDTELHGNPNKPLGASENQLRVRGEAPLLQVLRPEPGDVWPGPPPPQPTLQQLMKEENQQLIKPLPPPEIPGSPTPPPLISPNIPLPKMPAVPTAPKPMKPPPGAHMYVTPLGPMFGIPGPGGYETLTGPQGQTGGIVVPNGNGTSTIIMPNGQVLSVPTPK
jgi:hypothetical protein